MKKMKKCNVLSAAALLALTISLTGCGGTQKEDKSTGTAQDAIAAAVEAAQESEAEALKEENLGSNEGKDLSAYEKLYTFTLAGKELNMSCQLQEMLDDGWAFEDSAVTMDGADVVSLNESVDKGTLYDVIETPDFNMHKTIDGEDHVMMVGIYSDTHDKKTLGEYRVGYLYVKEDMGLDLEMNTGITFGSTIEEVKEVYGEPTSESEGIMSYQFGDEDLALMPNRPEFLNFYVNEGKVYMISMQYFPILTK